jgi:hypothetical protein
MTTRSQSAILIRDLLIRIPQEFPARVWRRNVGIGVRGNYHVTFGHKGESDIQGIIGPQSRFLAIEVKCSGRLSKEQKSFLKMIEAHGGIAIEARELRKTLETIRLLIGAEFTESSF